MKILAICLFLIPILFIIPVQAASVSVSPNVVLKNQYGKLTVLNSQAYDMFVLYANGTMFFNMTGLENFIGTFSFTAQSYGNGTLQLRFKAYQPTSVIQTAATSTYSSSNRYQQFTYTASQTSLLSLIFGVRVDISLINSALMLALFLPAALIALSLKMFGVKPLPRETPISFRNKALVLIIIVFILSLVALIVR